MSDTPGGTDVCADVGVNIVLPDDGIIRIESTRLFAEPDGLLCQRFVGRVLLAPGIDSVVITPATTEATTPTIELRFDATLYSQRRILEEVASFLDIAPSTPLWRC